MNWTQLLQKETLSYLPTGKMFAMVLAGTTAYFAFSLLQPTIDANGVIPAFLKPYIVLIASAGVAYLVDHRLLEGLVKAVAILYADETKRNRANEIASKLMLTGVILRLSFSIFMTIGSGTFMGFSVGGEGGDGTQLSQQDREARKERSEYQKATTAQIAAALSSAERSAELKRDNARKNINTKHVQLYDNGNEWFNGGDGPAGRKYAGHRASLKALRKIDADHAKALDAAAATADRARETMRADLKRMEKGASAAFGSLLIFEESKEGSKRTKSTLGVIFFLILDLSACSMVLLIGFAAGRALAGIDDGADQLTILFQEQVGAGRVLKTGLLSVFDIVISSLSWLGAHISLASSSLRLSIATTVEDSEGKRSKAHEKLMGAYNGTGATGRNSNGTGATGQAQQAQQQRNSSATGRDPYSASGEGQAQPSGRLEQSNSGASGSEATENKGLANIPDQHKSYVPTPSPTLEEGIEDDTATGATEAQQGATAQQAQQSETAQQAQQSATNRNTSATDSSQGATTKQEKYERNKKRIEEMSPDDRAARKSILAKRTSALRSMSSYKSRAMKYNANGDKVKAANNFQSAIDYAGSLPDDEVVVKKAKDLIEQAKKLQLEVRNPAGIIINEK